MQSLRTTLCACLLLSVPATAAWGGGAGPGAPWLQKTYTYKQVGDLEIQADVFRADDDEIRPVVVWIHGGALIVGGRGSVPGRLKELCRSEGYALISLDYRLAPEVKLPAIIEDVKDAFRWIREKGPTLLKVDPSKLVVTGGSAGGYLTMMTGICVEPDRKRVVEGKRVDLGGRRFIKKTTG